MGISLVSIVFLMTAKTVTIALHFFKEAWLGKGVLLAKTVNLSHICPVTYKGELSWAVPPSGSGGRATQNACSKLCVALYGDLTTSDF